MISRRQFIDTLAMGTAAVAINSTAKSYGQILGSNDRVNFAVIGLNGPRICPPLLTQGK